MYICAGEIEQFDFATPVGIGLVDVAINLTKICIQESPKELIFVGSAGSYAEAHIHDIVHSRSASNIENSFFSNGSYTPIENIVSHETSGVIVNSSNYITTDSSLWAQYNKMNIKLENMEFYSVLKVAKRFGIEARGIFVVTNSCDKNAHSDFMKNYQKGIEMLTSYVQGADS